MIAAEGVGGGAWSPATRSLCGREQLRASLCLSFPTDNNREVCYPQGNRKHFIGASCTFGVEQLLLVVTVADYMW